MKTSSRLLNQILPNEPTQNGSLDLSKKRRLRQDVIIASFLYVATGVATVRTMFKNFLIPLMAHPHSRARWTLTHTYLIRSKIVYELFNSNYSNKSTHRQTDNDLTLHHFLVQQNLPLHLLTSHKVGIVESVSSFGYISHRI